MCNQMRSNRLILLDIEFGKDDVQSSSVINDALPKNKQYICCHIYGLISVYLNCSATGGLALKISGKFRLFCPD